MGVVDVFDCQGRCQISQYDRYHYIDVPDCGCKGVAGNLPFWPDPNGGEWRYVVVVDQCVLQADDVCWERHVFWTCLMPG